MKTINLIINLVFLIFLLVNGIVSRNLLFFVLAFLTILSIFQYVSEKNDYFKRSDVIKIIINTILILVNYQKKLFRFIDDIKIFLISLKAFSTGLNIIGADTIIHFEPCWNVSVENQANDRSHRIGQMNSVHIIKFVCENLIEKK